MCYVYALFVDLIVIVVVVAAAAAICHVLIVCGAISFKAISWSFQIAILRHFFTHLFVYNNFACTRCM